MGSTHVVTFECMNIELKKHLREALDPITSKISAEHWRLSRAVCLSSAGASLAVMLVVVQLYSANPGPAREWALGLSSSAVPVWISLWAFCEPYAFWEREAAEHSRSLRSIALGGLLFVTGAFLLWSAIAAVLCMFAPVFAALSFAVGVVCFGLVFWQNVSTQKAVKAYLSQEQGTP